MGIEINLGGKSDKPTWETEGIYAINRGKMSLYELNKRFQEGWICFAIVGQGDYFYFIKVK